MTLHIQLRSPKPARHPNHGQWNWGGAMNWGQRFTFLLAALLFSGCAKTVTWEEEVPLNTGEVIWVKRIVTYKLEGASGNPLDIAYRPDWKETLEFMWDGKAYSYTGDADIMIIAISPTAKTPVLVARAALKNWDNKNSYRCTTPFYVQFLPDEGGRRWNWPPAIESWLFEMPYNLMYYRPSVDGAKSKFTVKDRFEKDQTTRSQSPSLVRIDPNDTFDQCRK
jgi:hypothetical protein